MFPVGKLKTCSKSTRTHKELTATQTVPRFRIRSFANPYGPALSLPSGSTCLVSLRETTELLAEKPQVTNLSTAYPFLYVRSLRSCRVEPNRPDVSRRETQDEPEGFAATLEASGIYLSTMPRFAAPSRAWTTLALSHS